MPTSQPQAFMHNKIAAWECIRVFSRLQLRLVGVRKDLGKEPMPVTFAASTVPFFTTWKVACAPSLMVLPALLNVFARLWKKPPMSAEDCVALAAMSARQKKAFSFVIVAVYGRCAGCDL